MVFLLINVTKNSKFWTHKILTFKSTLSNLCPGVCGKVVFVGLPEKCVEIQRKLPKPNLEAVPPPTNPVRLMQPADGKGDGDCGTVANYTVAEKFGNARRCQHRTVSAQAVPFLMPWIPSRHQARPP